MKPLIFLSRIFLLGLFIGLLTACEKPVNPNDLPVSYWADPKTDHDVHGSDQCSIRNAQAIVKSGLPFPNYTTKDEYDSFSQTTKQRIVSTDFWIDGIRYVFPAEIVKTGGYPRHHPKNHNGLQGSLPNFYPKGEYAPVKDGMGAMVDIDITCSLNADFLERVNSDKRIMTLEEGIQYSIKHYEQELSGKTDYPGTVTVIRRDDLQMMEVLLDRKLEANNQRYWEAMYWPLNTEMRDFDGSLRPIGCSTRNDPQTPKRYGNRGWTCATGLRISPSTSISISIYVSHIDQMPKIFEQVKKVVINAKKAGE